MLPPSFEAAPTHSHRFGRPRFHGRKLFAHGEFLVLLARVLKLSADESLGLEKSPPARATRDRRLLRRLPDLDNLPSATAAPSCAPSTPSSPKRNRGNCAILVKRWQRDLALGSQMALRQMPAAASARPRNERLREDLSKSRGTASSRAMSTLRVNH